MANADRIQLIVLLTGAQASDERALEELLKYLHIVISRFLARRLTGVSGGEAFVEDVAIEALVRIANNINSCRATQERQLIAWALAIARNTSIDFLRTETRHAAQVVAQEATVRRAGVRPRALEAEPSPAEQALCDLVKEIHDSLPTDLQLLLWLRLVVGSKWAEVADELSITPAAAKRRYQRGQQRLRRELTKRIHHLTGRDCGLVLERLSSLGVSID